MTKLTYDDPSISSGSSVNHFCVSLSNLTARRFVDILCIFLLVGATKAEQVSTSTKDNIIIKEFIMTLNIDCFATMEIELRGRSELLFVVAVQKKKIRSFLADIKSHSIVLLCVLCCCWLASIYLGR